MTPTSPPLPQPKFDQFYKHAELTTLLKEFAEARPDLLELLELGRSHEGHAPPNSMQAFLPNKTLTGDRAINERIIRAPAGSVVSLSAHAGRAGRIGVTLNL